MRMWRRASETRSASKVKGAWEHSEGSKRRCAAEERSEHVTGKVSLIWNGRILKQETAWLMGPTQRLDLKVLMNVSKLWKEKSFDLEGARENYARTNRTGVSIVDLTRHVVWKHAGQINKKTGGNLMTLLSQNASPFIHLESVPKV